MNTNKIGARSLLVVVIVVAGACDRRDSVVTDKTHITSGSASANLGSSSQVAPTKLSELEASVLAEMNFARQRPAEYAGVLREIANHFEGNLLRMPGRIALSTEEGVSAFKEAIAVLDAAVPVGPLNHHSGLHLAARDHVLDTGPKGQTAHEGSDGSKPVDRINRYTRWLGSAGENLAFGPDTGRDVVAQLVADDGVPSRGHRKNILAGHFALAGVACGDHAKYRTMCTIDFADGAEP